MFGNVSFVSVRFSEARREVFEFPPDVFVQSDLRRRIEQKRGPMIDPRFFESVVRVEPAADGVDLFAHFAQTSRLIAAAQCAQLFHHRRQFNHKKIVIVAQLPDEFVNLF